MNNYVELACRTESKPTPELLYRLDKAARIVHAVFGLSTETGEMIDNVKRHVFYGAALDVANLKEEAGDLCWYLAILFDELGTNFDEVMATNIAKLRARYPAKFDAGQAVNRNLDAERGALENSGRPWQGQTHNEDYCDE